MKEGIHPKFQMVDVVCACGNKFTTGSTKNGIKVEVCSQCHPFYTGSKRLLVEEGGRVDKFKKKYGMK
ncbi:MAG: 50S ribosomal protein L31 [Dehalobacterium sp.]|jgi:large subunit ribosomal protein L31